MVVDEATGKLISEIGGKLNRVHGVAFSYGTGHGFITSGGDSTVTMFDLATRDLPKVKPVPRYVEKSKGLLAPLNDAIRSDVESMTKHGHTLLSLAATAH